MVVNIDFASSSFVLHLPRHSMEEKYSRSSNAAMNAVLHLFEPEEHAARLIAAPYIDAELLGVVASVDEAPKLAHSLAIEVDEALGEEAVAGRLTSILISEAEDLETHEACLRALGVAEPDWQYSTLAPRDFDALRRVGFCRAGTETGKDASSKDDLSTLTLLNGEQVAGLVAPSNQQQAVLDATAALADNLEDGFALSFESADGSNSSLPFVVGGTAPDGCIVGVLGVSDESIQLTIP